jgi:hypothetical protein
LLFVFTGFLSGKDIDSVKNNITRKLTGEGFESVRVITGEKNVIVSYENRFSGLMLMQ